MATKATLASLQKTVATAGTQLALTSTTTWVRKATIVAPSANAGAVYIGTSTVDSSTGLILAAGQSQVLEVLDPDKGDAGSYLPFDLSTIYVDAATNGDKVSVIYWTYS